MFLVVVLVIALSQLALTAADNPPIRPDPNTIDTLPPVLSGTLICQTFIGEATEYRNDPNPPEQFPRDSAQVETGIAWIDTLSGSGSFNVRLTVITDSVLPREPSYKSVVYRIDVVDATKDAYCVYYVQDWADNVTLDTIHYTAPVLRTTPTVIDFGDQLVGSRTQRSAWITNTCAVRVRIDSVTLAKGWYFEVTFVSVQLPYYLDPEDSISVGIVYRADRETELITADFDTDTLLIHTECRRFHLNIKGVTAEPRITVEDFDAGVVEVGTMTCKYGGLKISSYGTDTVVISNITSNNWGHFTLSPSALQSLPVIILPGQTHYLKDVCYQRFDDGIDSTIVYIRSNARTTKDTSIWTGRTPLTGINESDTQTFRTDILDGQIHVAWKGASVTRIAVWDITGRLVRDVFIDANHTDTTLNSTLRSNQTVLIVFYGADGLPLYTAKEIIP